MSYSFFSDDIYFKKEYNYRTFIQDWLFIMKLIFFLLGMLFSNLLCAVPVGDQIVSLPGLGVVKNKQYSGYLPVSKTGSLFYWYVEKDTPSKDAPLVLWLNGGPGCSSLYGFFMENGPYQVNDQGELSPRQQSLTQFADYLVIDQPAGVGYSQGTLKSYANESQAMDQLYSALQQFYKMHPDLADKPLFLAGQSYAGKYLPQLAIRILKDAHHLHLQGLILGDPWVNPRLQQQANIDYAYYHGLIDDKAREQVKDLYQTCVNEIDKKTPSSRKANRACRKIQEFIKLQASGLNLVNVSTGKEPDDSLMVKYLNRKEVRKALHIPNKAAKFSTFSDLAADVLEVGEQDSVAHLYPELLKAGIKILIYNGLDDGTDSSFLSADLWLAALNQPAFAKAQTHVWKSSSEVAGYIKSANGLTQVKVRGAGHLAPIDQPERIYELFQHFVIEKSLLSLVAENE